MLQRVLSLFRKTQPPQPQVAPDPQWTVYKTHLRMEKLRARRELSIGFVPALIEHIDREYKL